MFTQLKIELEYNEKLDYKKSSLLQGVLFENIDSEYASIMHQQNLHPYSQFFNIEDDKMYWYVNAIDEEAYEKIIEKLLKPEFSGFKIKKDNIDVNIVNKNIRTIYKKELSDEFYNKDADRVIEINLLTPMAFKQRGVYISYIDFRLIYQSLMNKYNSISEKILMLDEDALFDLYDKTLITKYNLRSVPFPLESIKINGAFGNIRINLRGSDVMSRYARFLLRFAEFSGIGVKTGMGMGAVKINIGGVKCKKEM